MYYSQWPPYHKMILSAHLLNWLVCVCVSMHVCVCTRTEVNKITFGRPPARKLSLLNTKSHLSHHRVCVCIWVGGLPFT